MRLPIICLYLHQINRVRTSEKKEKHLLSIDLSLDNNKPLGNKFVEMNVDGNGSISSGKSSTKRRAPTAPHVSQNNAHNPVSTRLP